MVNYMEEKKKVEGATEVVPSKKRYKELAKEYDALDLEYIRAKNAIKDQKREQLRDLKDSYKIKKLELRSPLKAQKYANKVDARKRHAAMNEAPRRGLLEEIGNSISHGLGAGIGLVALILMVLKSRDGWSLTAAIIYGCCFFFQMLFSCLYHAFRGGSTVKRIFRRFDYSSIYLEIGGTLTPLYLLYMGQHPLFGVLGETWGIAFFMAVWALIITGITFVAIFGPGRLRWLHFTLYFVIGWSAIMFIPTWINETLPLFLWIIAGGVTYTLGMIPFAALRKKPVAHFIWHLVVLLAAIFMWIGIYLYVF